MKKFILYSILFVMSMDAHAQFLRGPNPDIIDVKPFSQQFGLVKLRSTGQWHFVHLSSPTYQPNGYEHAMPYSEGFAAVKSKGENSRKWSWKFISLKGKIHETPYDAVRSFKDGLAAVRKGDKWGFINTDLEEVIPCQYEDGYEYAYDFSEGCCKVIVKKRNYYHVMIDKAGNPKQTYDSLATLSNGLALIANNRGNNIRWVDKDGKLATHLNKKGTPKYAGTFSEKRVAVTYNKTENLLKYLNIEGDLIHLSREGFLSEKKEEYYLHDFKGGRAAVKQGKKWYFIDMEGNPLTRDESYDEVTPFSEKVAAVRQKEHWYFIDLRGQQLTPFFEAAKSCTEGVAWVKQKGNWGLISFLKKPIVKIISPQTDNELLVDTALIVKAEIISPVMPQKVTLYLNGNLVADNLIVTRKDDTTFYVEQRTQVKIDWNTIRIVANNSAGETEDTRNIQCDTTIKYYGLMIANTKYNLLRGNINYADLKNPIKDAEKFRTCLLNDYNFTAIDTLYNGTLEDMKAALQDFACKYNQPKAHIVIFYSGHGEEYGALCPSPTKEGKYQFFTSCDTKESIGLLTNVAHVLLIIDACYAGGWKCVDTKNQKTVPLNQCPAEALEVTGGRSGAILTAAENKIVKDDGIFMEVLLDILDKNEAIELLHTKLMDKIRDGVVVKGINNYPRWLSLGIWEDDGKFLKFRKSMRMKPHFK